MFVCVCVCTREDVCFEVFYSGFFIRNSVLVSACVLRACRPVSLPVCSLVITTNHRLISVFTRVTGDPRAHARMFSLRLLVKKVFIPWASTGVQHQSRRNHGRVAWACPDNVL